MEEKTEMQELFEESIIAAKEAGVPEELILKDISDIDRFFTE